MELPGDTYDTYIMRKGDVFIANHGRNNHLEEPMNGEEVSGYHGTCVKRLNDSPVLYSYWIKLGFGVELPKPKPKPKVFVPRSVYHSTPLPLP